MYKKKIFECFGYFVPVITVLIRVRSVSGRGERASVDRPSTPVSHLSPSVLRFFFLHKYFRHARGFP